MGKEFEQDPIGEEARRFVPVGEHPAEVNASPGSSHVVKPTKSLPAALAAAIEHIRSSTTMDEQLDGKTIKAIPRGSSTRLFVYGAIAAGTVAAGAVVYRKIQRGK